MNDMTIEELRNELDRREIAARTVQIEKERQHINYAMVALWGLVIGAALATCAVEHLK
jgi:uncharacterized membrane protein